MYNQNASEEAIGASLTLTIESIYLYTYYTWSQRSDIYIANLYLRCTILLDAGDYQRHHEPPESLLLLPLFYWDLTEIDNR